MAQNATIGALRVDLGINSANFASGLKTASKNLDGFSKQMKVVGAAIGAAVVGITGAFAAGVKATINMADEMSKASQKFGVAVEDLQRLKYAADLSGVSFEGLGTGLQRLSRTMTEAFQGGTSSGVKALQALGISVTDANGRMKDTPWIMEEVAARFNQMEDGATKTALAMSIFGRSGADLIPMLNGGGDALRSMMQRADELGIVISSNTARAAERFNDNLADMWRAKDSLFVKISAELLPAMERLSEVMRDFANNGPAIEATANGIGWTLKATATVALRLAEGIARVRAEISNLSNVGQALGNLDWAGAADAWSQGVAQSNAIGAQFDKLIETLWDDTIITQSAIADRINRAFQTSGESAGEAFVAGVQSKAAAPNAFEQIVQRMQESIAQLQVDAEAVNMTTGAATQYTAQLDLMRAATEAGLPMTDALTERINLLAEAFARASLARDGALLGQDLQNSPFDQFEMEMARIDELLANGAINWKTWADAATRARMSIASEVLGLAGQMTGALGQMFGDSKAFAIAEAIVNTAQAITKTLATYGATPWGIAAAGVAGAAGAAQIATIARTNKGSRSAPSVSTGGGSVGQAPEQTQQQTLNLTLRGLDPRQLYSGEQVRDLATALVDFQRDGGQLVYVEP